MSPILVALPSEAPGGLDALLSAHFGHCAAYTVVRVEDGKAADVEILANGGHEEGGCTRPVEILAKKGVTAMIAGGMGMRPLAAMREAGITVYFSGGFSGVRKALDAFIQGKLTPFGDDRICTGCGGHH